MTIYLVSRKNVCVTLDKMHGKRDAAHSNPLRRVMILDLLNAGKDYNRDRYPEMLLEAAETALGY